MQANPALNAVVEDLSAEALSRARDLDTAVAKGGAPAGPLHGVPVTIKINVDQKGHATSNGVVALKDVIAPDDAPVVRNSAKRRGYRDRADQYARVLLPRRYRQPACMAAPITLGAGISRPADLRAGPVRR